MFLPLFRNQSPPIDTFGEPVKLSSSPSTAVLAGLVAVGLVATSCGEDTEQDAAASAQSTEASSVAETTTVEEITIGAIPDQDPEKIARNYGLLAEYLEDEIGVSVDFQPVTEYAAAVSAFRVGDLDLVWFGGLTGVQARLQVDGAEAIAQRDIDAEFTSVFIAGTDTGIDPVSDVEGLTEFAGHSLTFGSESSTSGRLMPQYFLDQAGVSLDDLDGQPGFSGAHDKTIALVESGTFEAGALNSQVWASAVEGGTVDLDEVQLIFETPPYFDYHWVVRPEIGDELEAEIVAALSQLDASDPEQAEILDFFGAVRFIETNNDNYLDIETVARDSGLVE